MRRPAHLPKRRDGIPLPPSVFAARNGNKKPKKLSPVWARQFLLRPPPCRRAIRAWSRLHDWSPSLLNILTYRFPKWLASPMAASAKKYSSNIPLHQQPYPRRHPERRRDTAASAGDGEAAGDATRAAIWARRLRERQRKLRPHPQPSIALPSRERYPQFDLLLLRSFRSATRTSRSPSAASSPASQDLCPRHVPVPVIQRSLPAW